MKRLHKFKVDAEHFVIVFDNNSKSNYNRFIAVYNYNEPNQSLYGTTLKSTDTKEQILKCAKLGVKLYTHSNEMQMEANDYLK